MAPIIGLFSGSWLFGLFLNFSIDDFFPSMDYELYYEQRTGKTAAAGYFQ